MTLESKEEIANQEASGFIMAAVLFVAFFAFFIWVIGKSSEQMEYNKEFKHRCEANGGVYYLKKKLKSSSTPVCLNPAHTIHIPQLLFPQ